MMLQMTDIFSAPVSWDDKEPAHKHPRDKKKKLKTDKYQPKINFQHINLMDLLKLNCILFRERDEKRKRVFGWLNDV